MTTPPRAARSGNMGNGRANHGAKELGAQVSPRGGADGTCGGELGTSLVELKEVAEFTF
jgi:hypothetical protein